MKCLRGNTRFGKMTKCEELNVNDDTIRDNYRGKIANSLPFI